MQFYDMHTHLLPKFDDGAKSVEDSLKLLACLKKQGVNNVCLTPHFYTHEMSVENFVALRDETFRQFIPYMPDDMNIVLGTEVYVTQYLFSSADISALTYGKSRFILAEFPYNVNFSGKSMELLENLICVHNLIPVIPHIERYHEAIDNPQVLYNLKDMGVVIQTNASTYAKKSPIMKRRKMIKLIEDGFIDIISTDAHSFSHNTPEAYSQAVKYIGDRCGKTVIEKMMRNAEIIFNAATGKKIL